MSKHRATLEDRLTRDGERRAARLIAAHASLALEDRLIARIREHAEQAAQDMREEQDR